MADNFQLTQIQQVTLPNAAAIEFGGGDVRHYSPDDANTAVAIANPTRQLAARDNLLGEKINEVITVVNNKEQYISIPIPRTTLPPGGASEVVTNYRIPAGFEARILNASVSPAPTSLLEVLYSEGTYGTTTGIQIVATTGAPEFTAGTVFYRSGEFIIKFANNDTVSRELVASVMLTMRPVGPQSGGIIGPGAVGEQGPKGDKGDPGTVGAKGDPGDPGNPGLVWRGLWHSGSNYLSNDVVTHDYYGTSGTSSYVALVDNSNSQPPPPPTETNGTWQMLAEAGASANSLPGPQGEQGPIGINFRGVWNSGAAYLSTDTVTFPQIGMSGTVHRTFYATSPNTNQSPDANPALWTELFGPSIFPYVAVQLVSGSYVKDSGYVAGPSNESYVGSPSISSGAGVIPMNCFEHQMQAGESSIALLKHQRSLAFSGKITGYLPAQVNGSAINWTISDISLNVDNHGTYNGTHADSTIKFNVPGGSSGNVFSIEAVTNPPETTNVYVSFTGWSIY
jgi:hypothetical protein